MLKNKLDLSVKSGDLTKLTSEGLVLGLFEGQKIEGEFLTTIDKMFDGTLKTLIEKGEITGEMKEFHILHNVKAKAQKLIVLGCGKKDSFTKDTMRFFAAKGARTARKLGQKEATLLLQPFPLNAEILGSASAEGVIMGLDRFEVYKTKTKGERDHLKKVVLFCDKTSEKEVKAGLERGEILGYGNTLTRDIANHPGNKMTPSILADEAAKVAKAHGLGIEVLDEPELKKRGFEGICGVSQGSAENCKLIMLTYKGRPSSKDIDVAIVGKGLTFDAGGISIKPADKMHLMKYDMCGGAATIGAAYITAHLKPKINVKFYIPSSENLPDGLAYKPGDILKMYGGKTVEIINTDAEGRLLLADAIALAVEEGAKRIIEASTLTGAITVALGHVRTGLFCKDSDLKSIVNEAAEECDEKVWELPLDDEFKVSIKSPIADIVNSGGRAGGSITAAVFLNEFSGHVPYCHLDIAGTAWVENVPTQYSFKPYLPREGATGTVARTFALAIEKLAHKK